MTRVLDRGVHDILKNDRNNGSTFKVVITCTYPGKRHSTLACSVFLRHVRVSVCPYTPLHRSTCREQRRERLQHKKIESTCARIRPRKSHTGPVASGASKQRNPGQIFLSPLPIRNITAPVCTVRRQAAVKQSQHLTS